MASELRVLLVEDQPADAEAILLELSRSGYSPQASRVETEAEYVALLDCDWHVIIARLELRQFSGQRALDLWRARHLDIPFIIVSGGIDEAPAVEAMTNGAHDYVMKDRLARLGPAVARELRYARERAERRRAVDALRTSERRYALLAEAAHDLIFLVNRDGVIEYANAFAASQAGVSAQALVGTRLTDLLPGEIALLKLRHVRRAIDSGEPLYVEGPSVLGGKPVWLGSWLVPVTEAQGSPPNATLIVSRDITDARRLSESQALLATAVEQAGESIIVTGADGTIQYVNPAFERASGYSSADVVGRNPRLLRSGRHDDQFYRQMWTTLLSGQVWQGHLINRRKDGTLYEDDSTISPVRDAAASITHFVAVNRDVTEAMALQAQFYQAQKMETVGRLAGGIAHDFNNVLTVINGTADQVLEKLHEEDPLRNDLTQIRAAGERAAALTRQLLAFSRKQVVQPRVLAVETVVRDMEPMMRRLIGENVTLVVSSPAGAGHVRADPSQLEQVVINLVVNARDAMPHGGQLDIVVRNVDLNGPFGKAHGHTVRPGSYVLLEVSDTGTGMDELTRLRVFEPFFTTKEAGQGTGLGLSTVYGIVKQNEGHVEVSSEVGRGTTFKIYLPRVTAALATPPAQEAASPGGTETILLVEDEREIRFLATKILIRAGYAVLAASSGSEALEILAHHDGPVHLVITDLVLQDMSGAVLRSECRLLRPDVMVLFISGYTADVIVRHGVDEGVPFLNKPFSAAELTRVVRQTLDGSGISDPAR